MNPFECIELARQKRAALPKPRRAFTEAELAQLVKAQVKP